MITVKQKLYAVLHRRWKANPESQACLGEVYLSYDAALHGRFVSASIAHREVEEFVIVQLEIKDEACHASPRI